MSLSNIIKEIETNRPNAEMDIQLGSPNTYGGRVGLKRAATEAIERAKNQYRKELMASTAFIVVTGAGRDAFTQLATGETFGCFSTDPEDFFKDLAERVSPPQVKPSLFGRESVQALFSIAQNVLRDKAMEIDVDSYPPLFFSEKYNSGVGKVEDFVTLMKRAIVDQVGSEIVGINAISSIVGNAIERKHSATVTPLILNTSDEKFALDLATNLKKHQLLDGTTRGVTSKVFLVVAGKASKSLQAVPGAILVKTTTEDSVGEALTTIRSKIL